MDMIYCNKQAVSFLKRYKLPDEITSVSRRIFGAMRTSKLKELFPGEIYIYKNLEGSQSKWTFKFYICDFPKPLIGIFVMEELVSDKLKMNEIRQRFRLTRREVDILRRVIDGLKNAEIAENLDIAEQTVKDHLSNIYMKIGVGNRFTLIRTLIQA
jgi:DNA-binding CsgD family transcriptional regulator